METFDYIIVDDQNRWLSTGKNETEEQLQQEIAEVKTRLKEEDEFDTEVIVFKAKSMESYSV